MIIKETNKEKEKISKEIRDNELKINSLQKKLGIPLKQEKKIEQINKKKEDKSILGNIENKKKKLEQRKKKQIQYLKLLEQQTKVREQNIKNLDEQIDEQTQKDIK